MKAAYWQQLCKPQLLLHCTWTYLWNISVIKHSINHMWKWVYNVILLWWKHEWWKGMLKIKHIEILKVKIPEQIMFWTLSAGANFNDNLMHIYTEHNSIYFPSSDLEGIQNNFILWRSTAIKLDFFWFQLPVTNYFSTKKALIELSTVHWWTCPCLAQQGQNLWLLKSFDWRWPVRSAGYL